MNVITRFTARASLVSLALISASAFAQEAPAAGLPRAEVVNETLAARANGKLVPAGEGPDAAELALSRQAATYRMARDQARAERLAKR